MGYHAPDVGDIIIIQDYPTNLYICLTPGMKLSILAHTVALNGKVWRLDQFDLTIHLSGFPQLLSFTAFLHEWNL